MSLGQEGSGATERDDEERERGAQHGPVEADPTVGVDRPNWSNRTDGRQGHSDDEGEDAPREHCAQHPEHSREGDGPGAGPERAQHHEVTVLTRQCACEKSSRNDQGREGGDQAEHAERDSDRFDGAVHLGDDVGGDVEGIRGSPREGLDDLEFDLGDRAGPVFQLQVVVDVVASAGHERSRECRSEDHGRRVEVDLVEHDLTVEHHGADQVFADAQRWLYLGRAPTR